MKFFLKTSVFYDATKIRCDGRAGTAVWLLTTVLPDHQSQGGFLTDDSLLKILYLAVMGITKKWIGGLQDWSVIHA